MQLEEIELAMLCLSCGEHEEWADRISRVPNSSGNMAVAKNKKLR
jgi:hypothetical protein